ncbi:hypothetical protein FVF58_46675 [Paraburkholderia panacisoli]|uniref:Uncharacterized protein n=1 Tax=Paraburkholderia panacisoli TaxID=2603818 RepID=A0A5B0G371_9BURK|nr:hypothetical protein [Paraburkholderia panacisoli]KAA0997943.1 hypothetical protein FVF58_46675 [Paraburkholderia panacisoli]
MTMLTKWKLTVGFVCACCVAGTGHAEQSNNRPLKLLQLQTLNRMAPAAAPAKNSASSDNSVRQNRGADDRGSQPRPDHRNPAGNLPARTP